MRPDALVVGGGLAGGAAALVLARQGRCVLVLERERGPHDKLCGEFLSAEGAAVLRRLGLGPEALGAAPIEHVRLAARGWDVAAALPFRALGLSRRRLDAAILEAAEAAGAVVRRGVAVRALSPDGHASLADGTAIAAGRSLLATGKHGLRGWQRRPGRPLLALKLHLRLRPGQARALAGHVELHMLADGYAGLQMVEEGVANLCWLTRGRATTCPSQPGSLLGERLRGAEALMPRPLAVARVPYGHLHRPEAGEHVFRLGDQAAVTPSFTGDGMSIALHSGLLAALMLDGPAPAFHAALRRDVAGQVRRAGATLALLRTPLAALARLHPPILGMGAALTRLPARTAEVFKPLGLG